ncbi:MAG: hypothetical protein ACHQFW_09750 [Chitinophagales bacterium]
MMKLHLLFIFFILNQIVSAQATLRFNVINATTGKLVAPVTVSAEGLEENHVMIKNEPDTWNFDLGNITTEKTYYFILQAKDYIIKTAELTVSPGNPDYELDIKMTPVTLAGTTSSPKETFIQGLVKDSEFNFLENIEVILKISDAETDTAFTDRFGYYSFKFENKKIPSGISTLPIFFVPHVNKYAVHSDYVTLVSKQGSYQVITTLHKQNTIDIIKGKVIAPANFTGVISITLSDSASLELNTQPDQTGNYQFQIDTFLIDPLTRLQLKCEAEDLVDTIIYFTPRSGPPGLIKLTERPLYERSTNSLMLNVSLLPGLRNISYHVGYLYFAGGKNSHIAIGGGLGYSRLIGHPIDKDNLPDNTFDPADAGYEFRSVYFGVEARYYYFTYNRKQPLFNPTAQLALYLGPSERAKLFQPKLGAGTFINFTESIAAIIEAEVTMNFYDSPVYNPFGDYTGVERKLILVPFFNIQFNYIIPLE